MQIASSLSLYGDLEFEKVQPRLTVTWNVTAPLGLLRLAGIERPNYHERSVRPGLCVYPVCPGMCLYLEGLSICDYSLYAPHSNVNMFVFCDVIGIIVFSELLLQV